jgi:hypothetical protein
MSAFATGLSLLPSINLPARIAIRLDAGAALDCAKSGATGIAASARTNTRNKITIFRIEIPPVPKSLAIAGIFAFDGCRFSDFDEDKSRGMGEKTVPG